MPLEVSVIVPVYNAAPTLVPCLDAALAPANISHECIVVDDSSTDNSGYLARQRGARVVTLTGGPFGPAFARNRGGEAAHGDILFFVDADVVLAPEALSLVTATFHDRPDLAAVFGSYDASPAAKGIISRYRNLLHHFVHQTGRPDASTFWAGCGAIRRSVFQQVSGFDEKSFSRPSIEDIELGYRLRQSGHRILLEKKLQGTHLKHWDFCSLLLTDIARRALPWSRLILATKELPDDLNLKLDQRVSFVLVALACIFIALAWFEPLFLIGAASALLAVGVINRRLYHFFLQRGGILFAAASVPLHLLYYLYSGLSYSWAWAEFQLRKRHSLE